MRRFILALLLTGFVGGILASGVAAGGGAPPSTHGKGASGGVFRTSPHGKR